ncbi:MAG: beta-D-hydroxybutyrate dehydrogenase [Sphingomonadales bacterium 32-67-7]|nr:MAG: beta-D-hydroxybutyrate dehydrogenase [Sphingomonadales bacterium 32-67-7]
MENSHFLTGRRALVTGSVAGLGFAMAEALARAGADVMLTGLEPAAEVEASRRALADDCGVKVGYCAADVARIEDIERLVATTNTELGGVDILVNNAVVRHFAPIEDFPVGRWDAALAVNVSAVFHAIRLVLPQMRAGGYGRIVNMTSVYGERGVAQRIDYVTSKAAIQGLTRAVAMEVAGGDVTCHALRPGSVLTPAIDGRVEALRARETLSRRDAETKFLAGKQPSGRFVEMDSVCRALLLLCGPAGPDMNGAILPIEGGWLAS